MRSIVIVVGLLRRESLDAIVSAAIALAVGAIPEGDVDAARTVALNTVAIMQAFYLVK